MTLANHIEHILKINHMPWMSKAMVVKVCTVIRTFQTTFNKVIRVPIKPAVIIQLGWTWFIGSVENEKVCLMR